MQLDLATILTLHPLSLTVGALCFLYLRYRSRRSRGLGKMAMAFLVLACGSLLGGAGEQGRLDYAAWTFLSFVSGPVAYTLFFIGLLNLLTERPAGGWWWIVLLPIVLGIAALVTQFPSRQPLSAPRSFSRRWASMRWPVERSRSPIRSVRQLGSRFGLAASLFFKALIALATLVSIARPDLLPISPEITSSF